MSYSNTVKGTPFTENEQNFIRENYLLFPVKRVAKMVGRSEYGVANYLRRNNLVVPPELVEQRKKDSQIKKGAIPPNKGKKLTAYCSPEAIERMRSTQFKKGNLPFNTAECDGAIRIRKESEIIRKLELQEKIKIVGGIYNIDSGKVNFLNE